MKEWINKYSYAIRKLRDAIFEMAIMEGNVRSRLLTAMRSFQSLDPDDFPESLQEEWIGIVAMTQKHGPVCNNSGEVHIPSVENTLSRMIHTTGSKIASRIVDLYIKLVDSE